MGTAPIINEPQPGFYKTRLVRGGAWVPARIWRDDSIPERSPVLIAEINGEEIWDTHRAWISLCGNPITEAEFRYMSAVKDHVEKYEPEAPEANPTVKIDLHTQPAFGPKSLGEQI